MQVIVLASIATPVRRAKGSTVTIVNQSAVDVYLDTDPNRLNSTVTGSVPTGTRLVAAGGQLQITDFPGLLWFRSATDTTIEVQP